MKLRSHSSCIYNLQYHLVITTKYRNKVITNEMKEPLFHKIKNLLLKWDCSIIEINGEEDHVHILFEAHPTLQLSILVNNIKSVSSRFLHKEFELDLKKSYWGTNELWNRSYCLLSTGGATIETVKRYIQNQGKVKI